MIASEVKKEQGKKICLIWLRIEKLPHREVEENVKVLTLKYLYRQSLLLC